MTANTTVSNISNTMTACTKINEWISVTYLPQFPNSGRYSAGVLYTVLVMTPAYGLFCKDHKKISINDISGNLFLQFNYVSHFCEAHFTTLQPNRLVWRYSSRPVFETSSGRLSVAIPNIRTEFSWSSSVPTNAMIVFQFTYPTIRCLHKRRL
jgi:hypothetical protein